MKTLIIFGVYCCLIIFFLYVCSFLFFKKVQEIRKKELIDRLKNITISGKRCVIEKIIFVNQEEYLGKTECVDLFTGKPVLFNEIQSLLDSPIKTPSSHVIYYHELIAVDNHGWDVKSTAVLYTL